MSRQNVLFLILLPAVFATLTSPKAEESPSVTISETLSTKDTIIFAFSGLYVLALRLWSFRTRLITTNPARWSTWQQTLLLILALVSHIVPILGTLYLDDPEGSESWAWAQIIPPLLPPAIIWAFSGRLKHAAREGRREGISMVGLVGILKEARWQALFAAVLLLADWAYLAWLQGFDVIALSVVSVVTIFLEIEPGRRLSTPLINRSRGSALGAGYAYARTTDIGAVSVIVSLERGKVVYEESIYRNPVHGGQEEDLEGNTLLAPSADVRHRFEALGKGRVRLGYDDRPEIVFKGVELKYDSVFPPEPGCHSFKCLLPDGLADWLAELANQQDVNTESCSLYRYDFMALFSLVVEEYRTTWREFQESEEANSTPVVQKWRRLEVRNRDADLIREASIDLQEGILSERREHSLCAVPSECYSPLRIRESLLHSPRHNAGDALNMLRLDTLAEIQADFGTFWSDGINKPPMISGEELLRRYPILQETLFNPPPIEVHEEYLVLPTPAIVLAALAVLPEDGIEDEENENEDVDMEKAVFDDPYMKVIGLFKEDRASEGLATRRKRYKYVRLWRKAASDGAFRVKWSAIRPIANQRKVIEGPPVGTSSSSDRSTNISDNDNGDEQDQTHDSSLDVAGAIFFEVLQNSADTTWVEAYADEFEKMLRDPRVSRIISQWIILSELESGENFGTRRLLEVRHAIVERLLLLQSVSSALIGAKALFAAL